MSDFGKLLKNTLLGGKNKKVLTEIGKEAAEDITKGIDILADANGVPRATKAMSDMVKGVEGAGVAIKGLTTSFVGLKFAIAAIAVFAVVKALTTSVAEVQEKVDNTKKSISDLESQISELENIGYRNIAQEERLNLLKSELEIQKEILKTQEQQIAAEQTKINLASLADKDSFAFNYVKNNAKTGYQITDYKQDLDNFNKFNFVGHEKDEYNNNQYNKYKGKLEEDVLNMSSTAADLLEQYNKAQEILSNELIDKDSEIYKNAEKFSETFKSQYDAIMEYVVEGQKLLGTYDYTNAFNGIIENYDGIKDNLVELYKSGDLTLSKLQELFNLDGTNNSLSQYLNDAIINKLIEAGLNAEEVYRIIQNISDPKKSWRTSTSNSLLSDLIGDQGVGSSSYDREGMMKQRLRDSGINLDDEEHLQAYLDVKTQYKDESQYWDYNTWIEHIKQRLENEELLVGVEFNMSTFEEQENDIESLQSLYNSFAENVENGEVKVPLDISDVESLREKWEDIVGKEQFDAFELTVTTDGFEKDYQSAFDSMLSSYLQTQISMRGATAETAAMMKTQLKMDGVIDEDANTFVDAKMAEAKATEYAQAVSEGASEERLQQIADETYALDLDKQMLFDYYQQALLAGNVTLDGDTTWLDILADKLGIDIGLLKELLNLANQDATGVYNGAMLGVPTDVRRKLNERKNGISASDKEEENNKKYETAGFDYNKAKQDASSGGSDAGDAYVEAFEEELKELEELRDAGIISEREYLERLKALYIQYFADRKKYITQFKKYEKEYLEGKQFCPL